LTRKRYPTNNRRITVNTKTDRLTLTLEDLNGHSTCRKLSDIESSLRETGGVVAFKRIPGPVESSGGVKLQAVVQCVYSPEADSFILKIKDEDGWRNRAQYSQGREEMAGLDFIREVFEAEGRAE
jgi:hypothetical protein